MAWEGASLDDRVYVCFVSTDSRVDLCFVAGEFRSAGRRELGGLGEEDSHVVEDVCGGGDELGSLLDEAV